MVNPSGGIEIERLDDAPWMVLGHGDLFADPSLEGNQGAKLADMHRRHPDAQAPDAYGVHPIGCSQQPCQSCQRNAKRC